jgi:hypothetical protein
MSHFNQFFIIQDFRLKTLTHLMAGLGYFLLIKSGQFWAAVRLAHYEHGYTGRLA